MHKQSQLHDELKAAFCVFDPDDEYGQVTVINDINRHMWEDKLGSPEMAKYLECLQISVKEARECDLFGLLDRDESGRLTAKELVEGCVRLAGSAKSMDLWCLHGH